MPELPIEEKRKLFYEAKATGRCRLCGWGDGDGTKICYYDPELGYMTHENSMEVAMAAMTVSQRSLLESYDSGKHAYISEEALKEDIENNINRAKKEIRELEGKIEILKERLDEALKVKTEDEWKKFLDKYGYLKGAKQEPMIDHFRRMIEGYRKNIAAYKKLIDMQMAERRAVLDYVIKGDEVTIRKRLKTVEDSEKEGYFVVRPEQLDKPFLGKMVWVQKPHLCGGFGRFLGPYHIGCTKCDEEVKLWEFGIDYDVG